MMIVERLKDTFRGVTAGWKESCEAGPPVPEVDGCHGVHCHSVRVTDLPRGGRASVSCLEEPWTAASAKLAGLGILPGVRLRVVQRSPAWVLKVGRTELALDTELAHRIRVVPEQTPVQVQAVEPLPPERGAGRNRKRNRGRGRGRRGPRGD
ncbi:MAG: FeoA family protein [Gemmatimonadota bacterium]